MGSCTLIKKATVPKRRFFFFFLHLVQVLPVKILKLELN